MVLKLVCGLNNLKNINLLTPPSLKGGVFYFLFIFINYIDIMNNEQKAEMYNQLMYEYTKTQNQISSIKGESINLNESQLRQIRELEGKLRFLMDKVSRL
jgi:hypothetical protein